MRVTTYLTLSALLIGCLLLTPATAQANSEPTDRAQFQAMYLDYVKAQGYEASVDSEGDIQIKDGRFTYFILVNENDPTFFGLYLPNVYSINTETSDIEYLLKVIDIVQSLTLDIKGMKVVIAQDNVWLAVEMFVEKPSDFKGVFGRVMSVMEYTRERFKEELEEAF